VSDLESVSGPGQGESWTAWVGIGRGFVESVTSTVADWLAHADLLLGRKPGLTDRSPASTNHIDPIVRRKRARATPKRTAPITARARNCGQTTSIPPPRNRMPWDSMTKWVVGAPSMIC
jgi:hypothetical protein